MSFDFTPLLPDHVPTPASRWLGFPEYNFVGGHIDETLVPVDDLRAAIDKAMANEGANIATYFLKSGPQGYKPCRDYVAQKLRLYCGIETTSDDILLTTGSMQALDLVNRLLLEKGDTVIVEETNYSGAFSRLRNLGVNMVAVPLDENGMRMDALEMELDRLAAQGVRPKYIYAIITVHNPTGTILPQDRREKMIELAKAHGVPILEDECYSDIVWSNTRPPALRALDDSGLVIHIGSFSKTIGPALRVGYINADWPVLSRLISLKSDAGSGALEQMMLAEYCPAHFDSHVKRCNAVLESKLDALIEALDQNFGAVIDYNKPPGGIFLWVKMPDCVKTDQLAAVARSKGVAVNPGLEWSMRDDANRWIRICFANPPIEKIRDGVEKLAKVCHAEFGVPEISGNIRR